MDNGGTSALAIIQTWDWKQLDFNSRTLRPKWLSLSKAVNSLAMSRHDNPTGAILELLCNGQLTASGDYQWRASRNGEEFSKAESDSAIPVTWWRLLLDGLAERDWRIGSTISLRLLEITDTSRAEWTWEYNRFSVACMTGSDWLDDDYAEEFVSAWNIEVHCPSAGSDNREAAAPKPAAIERRRGRPREYDWEGAMAHVVAVANTPDGLETGHGGQAGIERLIAEYFARTRDDKKSGTESEIRKRANLIMQAMEDLKTESAKAA